MNNGISDTDTAVKERSSICTWRAAAPVNKRPRENVPTYLAGGFRLAKYRQFPDR